MPAETEVGVALSSDTLLLIYQSRRRDTFDDRITISHSDESTVA